MAVAFSQDIAYLGPFQVGNRVRLKQNGRVYVVLDRQHSHSVLIDKEGEGPAWFMDGDFDAVDA